MGFFFSLSLSLSLFFFFTGSNQLLMKTLEELELKRPKSDLPE